MSCDANKVSKAQQNVGSSEMLNESAVLLSVKMDDQITSAIIDSRAGPNVIVKWAMLKLYLLGSINHQDDGHVLGVGKTKIPTSVWSSLVGRETRTRL